LTASLDEFFRHWNGERELTIVIFSSEHGAELGNYHNIHKGLHYERSAWVPFVVWAADRYQPKDIGGFF
jgi:arylsulfatase A-like enzyme